MSRRSPYGKSKYMGVCEISLYIFWRYKAIFMPVTTECQSQQVQICLDIVSNVALYTVIRYIGLHQPVQCTYAWYATTKVHAVSHNAELNLSLFLNTSRASTYIICITYIVAQCKIPRLSCILLYDLFSTSS